MEKDEHERLVNLAMQVVKGLMEMPPVNINCKCGHSAFDHSDDTGCDAKGCSCSEGFEEVASGALTKLETEIDNLHREINLLKATNHRLRTEKDNDYDAALEWAADWVTGAQLSGHSDEVQEYARNMAMSIRAAKRGLTKRALDGACESCKLELTPSCPIRTGNGCDLFQPRQ